MKEIKYQKVGDYEFPVLKGAPSLLQLSRFGMMDLQHLKENEKGHYFALMVENKLNDELKQKNQMKWVQEMNNIHNEVRRLIKTNYIYTG